MGVAISYQPSAVSDGREHGGNTQAKTLTPTEEWQSVISRQPLAE